MFIIVYILIAACACVMVYFGYQQSTEQFYMCIFSAAIVLYCVYLDFKKRAEKKKEKEKAAQMKGNKKNSIRKREESAEIEQRIKGERRTKCQYS